MSKLNFPIEQSGFTCWCTIHHMHCIPMVQRQFYGPVNIKTRSTVISVQVLISNFSINLQVTIILHSDWSRFTVSEVIVTHQ